MLGNKFETVDEYLSIIDPDMRKLLEQVRAAIRQAAPEAEELISYNMPAFKQQGMLVYYAAAKNHVGFYPGNPRFNEVFKEELTGYKTSKGAIQFPLDQPLPVDLIRKITAFRVEDNLEKAAARAGKKK